MFVNYRFSAKRAPAVGSANSMTPCSSRHCSIRRSLGEPVGLRSCLRSQNLTARSSTPSAAPSVRWVSPARTRAARSWRPVIRFIGLNDMSTAPNLFNGIIIPYFNKIKTVFMLMHSLYPVQAIIRNLFGSMTLKLSVMAQQNFGQFRGTFSHRKSRVTSANCAHVA